MNYLTNAPVVGKRDALSTCLGPAASSQQPAARGRLVVFSARSVDELVVCRLPRDYCSVLPLRSVCARSLVSMSMSMSHRMGCSLHGGMGFCGGFAGYWSKQWSCACSSALQLSAPEMLMRMRRQPGQARPSRFGRVVAVAAWCCCCVLQWCVYCGPQVARLSSRSVVKPPGSSFWFLLLRKVEEGEGRGTREGERRGLAKV